MHKIPLPALNTMPGQVHLPAFLLIYFSSPKHVIHIAENRNIPRAKPGKINPDSCKWLQAEFHHKQAMK